MRFQSVEEIHARQKEYRHLMIRRHRQGKITRKVKSANLVKTLIPIPMRPPAGTWFLQMSNIYVISIRQARYKACVQRMGSLAKYISKVDSVNGSMLHIPTLVKQRILKSQPKYYNRDYLRRGQIGCFMSHINAWNKLLKSENEYAFIVEDDVNINGENKQQYTLIQRAFDQIKALNMKWDLLYIGRNSQLCKVRKKVSTNLIVPGMTWGLFAYVINRHAAAELLKHAYPLSEAVDTWLTCKHNQNRIKMLAIQPIVCSVIPVISDTANII
jgi:glycosyl transferase family 25